MVTRHALNYQMSRSEPESGGLVLRMDQENWSVFKTDKQKKNGGQVVNAQIYVFYFESDIAKVFPFRPTCSSYDSEIKKMSKVKKLAKKDQIRK
jgi:hypothetical protein